MQFDFTKGSEAIESQIANAEDAREAAIEWQRWQAGQSLSWAEVSEWSSLFEALGRKFGLFDEFAENGII